MAAVGVSGAEGVIGPKLHYELLLTKWDVGGELAGGPREGGGLGVWFWQRVEVCAVRG